MNQLEVQYICLYLGKCIGQGSAIGCGTAASLHVCNPLESKEGDCVSFCRLHLWVRQMLLMLQAIFNTIYGMGTASFSYCRAIRSKR